MPKIHNGTYTIQNLDTGEHRTFQIRTVKTDGPFKGKRILSLLSGPDNTSNYTPFAFVNEDKVIVWHKKRAGENEKWTPFQWYADMFNHFGCTGGEYRGKNYRVEVSKTCLRCNRKLTNPASLDSGYGPECAQRL